MEQLIIQVAAGVIVLLIATWLGIGGSSVRVVRLQSGRNSRKWKWTILVSWLMIIAGLYIFSLNFPVGGFSNPYAGMGFSLAFLGLIGLGIGKLGSWWSRP